MKLPKILVAGVCALGFANLASAQTFIYITGSSAFRSATHTAIMKVLGGTSTTVPTAGGTGGYAYTGSTIGGANAATFRGYLNNDSTKPVVIKTSWSGSAAGIQTVAGGFTVKFLPNTVSLATTGTNGQTDPRSQTTASLFEAVVPDIAMADNTQNSTPFLGTFNGVTYTTLADNKVGVVPFQWVKSKGAAAGLTNITPQLAQALWTSTGSLPLALFTGNSGDQGELVYATGRDPDSGTRITAYAESGIGINAGVQQYDCDREDAVAPANTPKLYPAQTINTILYPVGQGGESSGGTLAGTTKMGKANLNFTYVSYMSTGDAATLVANGGATLTYNGVPYSLTNVQQGLYTFWGYEHLLYKPSLSGVKLTTANSLVSQITNTDAPIKLSDMSVMRDVDGGIVAADY